MTCLNKSFLRIRVDGQFHWNGAFVLSCMIDYLNIMGVTVFSR